MFKNRLKRIIDNIIYLIQDNLRFLIVLIVTYILCFYPVNYYIIVGGGISDISSRIKVEDGYKAEGSLNISYVSEVNAKLGVYLLSYIIPDWERESIDAYKFDTDESLKDIEFRNDKELEKANDSAIYWAYKLANKDYRVTNTHIYVIGVSKDFSNPIMVGDEIISINGTSYDNVADYRDFLQQYNKDDEVLVKVLRDEKELELKCKMYEEENTKILGIILLDIDDYDTDPDVSINFKSNESGPSGGLITTLSIYNQLVDNDITSSLDIAGTGTIEEDGTIGPIGGVKYKLLGAVKGKADVFIVPNGDNYKECVKLKKKKNLKIKIIGVSNIEEAISKLEKLSN